jgi:hypothetical protein
LSLEPGASVTLELIFAPTAATDYIGTLALAWGSYGRVLNLPVTGTGTGTGSISAVPATLSFGSVAVGSNSAKTATLSATGASTVISAVTTTNPEFTVSGFALPLSLTAGQTVSFTVKFAPLSAGSASASLAFATDGTGPVTSQALTGAGSAVAAADHSVSVSWADSTSDVTGYNVYRGATSGGPYAKVNAAADAGNAYTDTTVAGGTTYYYVVTAVDSVGTESAYSPEVAATVPSP